MRRVSLEETSNKGDHTLLIRPPPPPPASLSPTSTEQKSPKINFPNLSLEETTSTKEEELNPKESQISEKEVQQPEVPDDDFGDFQAAN